MSANFNEELIEQVKSSPCLYDKQHKRYFDANLKNSCWQEIATKLSHTPEECKTRWTHLRETFTRKCKPKSTGSGAEEDSWPYFESMSFLKSFVKPRSTKSNETQSSSSYSGDDICLSEESAFNCSSESEERILKPPAPKRKRTIQSTLEVIQQSALALVKGKVENSSVETNDTDELITKTVLRLLKDIPPHNKDKVRAELFQFVFAAREKYGAK